jgi:hypothetical protein
MVGRPRRWSIYNESLWELLHLKSTQCILLLLNYTTEYGGPYSHPHQTTLMQPRNHCILKEESLLCKEIPFSF